MVCFFQHTLDNEINILLIFSLSACCCCSAPLHLLGFPVPLMEQLNLLSQYSANHGFRALFRGVFVMKYSSNAAAHTENLRSHKQQASQRWRSRSLTCHVSPTRYGIALWHDSNSALCRPFLPVHRLLLVAPIVAGQPIEFARCILLNWRGKQTAAVGLADEQHDDLGLGVKFKVADDLPECLVAGLPRYFYWPGNADIWFTFNKQSFVSFSNNLHINACYLW